MQALCSPKNWEARSWSGEVDGHQELHAISGSLDRACGSSSSSSKWVWLPWPWWSWLARTVVGVQGLRSLGKAWIVLKSRILKLGLLQVNSTLSSIELSFLCLDSIESGGRAGASGLNSSSSSVC
ncbi:unnamed protein product [Microthlaspi erraticum]|uniref:Uncharacterized protein n=1 Tax=Microthlaspi erraticum TaxID=1685480 RepID=A0A6D2I6Y6_9BRAS|nr:unnamed protein product [Microthlaspi erraticum]